MLMFMVVFSTGLFGAGEGGGTRRGMGVVPVLTGSVGGCQRCGEETFVELGLCGWQQLFWWRERGSW